MNILAFDPGTTKGSAWAFFFDDRLSSVDFAHTTAQDAGYPGPGVDLVLIELPRWHKKADRSPAIVDDLIDLGLEVGKIVREYETRGYRGRIELVRASSWKGQVPKPIMSQRIYDSLSEVERERIPLKRGHRHSRSAESHNDNLLDACGLGLWKLGRLT